MSTRRGTNAAQGRLYGWWVKPWRKFTQKIGGGASNEVHGFFERLVGVLRRGADATHFSDVLSRCRFDFVVGGFWLESTKCGDVSAHA